MKKASPTLSIRRMTPKDLPQVLAIEHKAYNYPWSEIAFGDCLEQNYESRVCEIHNPQHVSTSLIIGYYIMMLVLDEAHLLNLCIAPEQQGQGLGKHLLRDALQNACEQGYKKMLLEVRASNTVAQNLYNSQGFRVTGLRKAYYMSDHGRENALLMDLSLS